MACCTDATGYAVDVIMAALFVMILPIVTRFLFVQRYFIWGIKLTDIKAQETRVTRKRTLLTSHPSPVT